MDMKQPFEAHPGVMFPKQAQGMRGVTVELNQGKNLRK